MHNRNVIVHSLTYKFLRGVESEILVTEERTLQLLYIWRYPGGRAGEHRSTTIPIEGAECGSSHRTN